MADSFSTDTNASYSSLADLGVGHTDSDSCLCCCTRTRNRDSHRLSSKYISGSGEGRWAEWQPTYIAEDGSYHDRSNIMGDKIANKSSGKNAKRVFCSRKYCCGRRLTKRCVLRTLIICVAVLVFLIAFGVLCWYLILPAIASKILADTHIDFQSVHMTNDLPTGQKSSTSIAMTGVASMKSRLPLDIGLFIHSLDVHSAIAMDTGNFIGRLVPSRELKVYQSDNGVFTLPAVLHIDNFTAFHIYTSHLLSDPEVFLRLTTQGYGATLRIHLPGASERNWFTDVSLPGIKFDKVLAIKGCDGFGTTNLKVFQLDDLPSKYKGPGLNVHVEVQVWNPSSANVSDMGIVRFDLFAVDNTSARSSQNLLSGNSSDVGSEFKVGFLKSDESLSIGHGWNTLKASGRFYGQGDQVDRLILNFVMGRPNTVKAKAPEFNASSDPLFSKFVGGLSITATLQGVESSVLKNGAMLLTAKVIGEILNPLNKDKPIQVPFRANLENPFGAELTITNVTLHSIFEGAVVGTASSDELSVVVGRYSNAWTPMLQLAVNMQEERDAIVKMLELMLEHGNVLLGAQGDITFTAGGLVYPLKGYQQDENIPSCIQGPLSKPRPCLNYTFTTSSK